MGGREKKNYDLPTRPRPPVATLTRRSASRLAHHSDLAGHHHHHDKAVRCLVYSPATLPQMEEGEKEDMKKIRLTEKKNQKKKNEPHRIYAGSAVRKARAGTARACGTAMGLLIWSGRIHDDLFLLFVFCRDQTI